MKSYHLLLAIFLIIFGVIEGYCLCASPSFVCKTEIGSKKYIEKCPGQAKECKDIFAKSGRASDKDKKKKEDDKKKKEKEDKNKKAKDKKKHDLKGAFKGKAGALKGKAGDLKGKAGALKGKADGLKGEASGLKDAGISQLAG